jgi:MGT family glycosyltransferase
VSRFLLATWDGGGVVTAELALAQALVARGHDVLVVADDTVAGDAARAGVGFRPWVRAPHARARDRDRALVRDWETRNPFSAEANIGVQLFTGPAARFADDVADAIADWHPDVLAVDAFLGGALAAAEASGLPFAAIAPNVNMLRAPGIPAIGGGFRPARGPLGRLRDRAMHGLSDRMLRVRSLDGLRAGLGLPPVHTMDAMVRRADRVILLTSAAFDFTPTAPDDQVVYGGIPEPRDDGVAWTPPWEAGAPAVLVALGTTFQDQGELLDRLTTALGGVACQALVTLGPGLAGHRLPRVPGNVHVVDVVPHGAVFPHVDVCVTHGGHGTVVRALAAGVPVLVVPNGRDQADNAARAVALGAGRRMSARASVDRLRDAVTDALVDGPLREAAHAVASRLAPDLGAPRAVAALEELATRTAGRPSA